MKKNLWLFRTALPLFIFLIMGYILARALTLDPHALPSALINQSAPEFNLPTLFDPKQQLHRNIFLGHISLLNVWASWCSTCMMEHPILMDIVNKYHIKIYGLNYKDERESAITFLQQFGNPYQEIGFDQLGNVAMNWGVYGTPETFVIDKKGIIRFKQLGPISENDWQHKILPLIRKLESDD